MVYNFLIVLAICFYFLHHLKYFLLLSSPQPVIPAALLIFLPAEFLAAILNFFLINLLRLVGELCTGWVIADWKPSEQEEYRELCS